MVLSSRPRPNAPRRGAKPSSAGPAEPLVTDSGTRSIALVLATACGAGLFPFAPGTVGSAVGVLVFWPLAALSAPLYALTVAGLVFVGVWAADEAERAWSRPDDGRIVIDEVAGQLIALSPLVFLELPHGWASVVTAFVLFRVFDVWKPGPVRWAERGGRGGVGVMMDDVVAGVLAAGTLVAILVLLPRFGYELA